MASPMTLRRESICRQKTVPDDHQNLSMPYT